MKKIVIAVHGGAGPDSALIRENIEAYQSGLEDALSAGHSILKKGGSSVDAVEAAINMLENNPLFNAGRGSVLNEHAQVEMDASIMNGLDLNCGAVSVVQQVKNPVTLARAIMEKSSHIYLGNSGALAFARQQGLELRPDAYFITEYNYNQYEEEAQHQTANPGDAGERQARRKDHGTVGAVALDEYGNLAAATSTGGLENKTSGRIADSSMIGVGTYADNKVCAVSCTGDGEYLMQHVAGFHLHAIMEYKGMPIVDACNYLIHDRCKAVEGDMGLIAIDPSGTVAFAFNSERMHRGWRINDEPSEVSIYPE
ncbi:isoaspartyl peptidase/L-asparaginase [Segetibacter sp. 3557_3]|uniref:isoaspartyl peptidase/L-asparaginase family protein n=1 Tax=Segetibacter sp. 3557_3 TaxID=2547429 RepID=UPI0010591238|nr:isoaspartyl peptidase/L-asparaginase [Segetibacter sp. 3557_3]TDH21439.1 isoaspartyl peptidase/L-asparaginase [Segetibacter sp. 3557_3]